jgi:hypothetical protein
MRDQFPARRNREFLIRNSEFATQNREFRTEALPRRRVGRSARRQWRGTLFKPTLSGHRGHFLQRPAPMPTSAPMLLTRSRRESDQQWPNCTRSLETGFRIPYYKITSSERSCPPGASNSNNIRLNVFAFVAAVGS